MTDQPKPNGLIIPGAEPLPAWTREDGLTVLVWGAEGVGKTDFAFSAAELYPVVLFDLEHNTKGPMRRWAGKIEAGAAHSIQYFRYQVPSFDERGQARETADKFRNDYHVHTIAHLNRTKQRGVLVIDTGTKLWELLRYAYVPLDDKGRTTTAWNFGPVNNMWRALSQKAKYLNQTLIIISRDEHIWQHDPETKKTVKTSEKEADIQDDTPWDADVVLHVSARPKLVAGNRIEQGRFVKVTKCNPNGALRFYEEENLSFKKLIGLIEVYE